MFFKPLFEKAIGKKDLEATVAYNSLGEGAEPGLEAMVNQLLLDVREGRLPDFLGQWGMSGHLISLLLPARILPMVKRRPAGATFHQGEGSYPHFFHNVGNIVT